MHTFYSKTQFPASSCREFLLLTKSAMRSMGTSGGELLLHVKDVFNSSIQVHLAALTCLLNKLCVTKIGNISCFYEGVPPLDLK